MAHTTTTPNDVSFIHDGDFIGDVTIVAKSGSLTVNIEERHSTAAQATR